MSKQTLFVVTDELQQVLDNLPAVAPRSRLDPLRPFILRWRRDGRSYRDIRAILKNQCGVTVCVETIHKFVKSRSKPRKPQPEPEIEQPTERVSLGVTPTGITARRTPDKIEADRAALRAAYDKPLFPTEEKKPLFVRRPGPIRNLNNEGEL
jgi:hypothetical protein